MMKKAPQIILILLITVVVNHSTLAQNAPMVASVGPKLMDVVPGVLYVTFKADRGIDFINIDPRHTGSEALDNLFAEIGVSEVCAFDPEAKNFEFSRKHGLDRTYVINYSDLERSPRMIGHEFMKLDVVQGCSPRFIVEKCYTPNDPQLGSQYALVNMNVLNAWGISKGDSKIIIADLDEGVNYFHEDLVANIYSNPGEVGLDSKGHDKRTNGVDDDGDGYIDNVIGIDMVGSKGYPGHFKYDNDPQPGTGQSHGTFTTGCFGAVPDNRLGGSGTGFNCKIMPIKIANDSGLLYAGYEGMHYAVTHGAKILNCSWGGFENDPTYIDYWQTTFIDEALDAGVLVVAAAGNSHYNNDLNPFYPANLRGVLSVGATDQKDAAASFSDYGKSVRVYAPGTDIFSTDFPGNAAYNYSGGTSFSCPLTAGVVGLLWAKNPTWSPKYIMRQMIESCDNVVNSGNRAQYWGRVNAYNALSRPTVASVDIKDFVIDGVDSAGLQYSNKTYDLGVVFKNYMSAGSGIIAKLIQVDGYKVIQGTATLGSMAALQQSTGTFQIKRDGLDNGAGSQLQLMFFITYGTATVSGAKYVDTLYLNVDITGDKIYVNSVKDERHPQFELGTVFPNPTFGDATISFCLNEREYARLTLSDVLGRPVSTLSEGIFNEGTHQVRFDTRGFENGIYTYRLETRNSAILAKRFIVVHQ